MVFFLGVGESYSWQIPAQVFRVEVACLQLTVDTATGYCLTNLGVHLAGHCVIPVLTQPGHFPKIKS